MKFEREPLRCSFCNKDQSDVKMLIAGPTVFICDACVARCQEIIEQDEALPDVNEGSGSEWPNVAWFSRAAVWLDEQIEVAERRARRLRLDRYDVRFLVTRHQMRLLRWFGTLVRTPPPWVAEHLPQPINGPFHYARGGERRTLERRLDFVRQLFQLVITYENETETVEEFFEMVPALDRERELVGLWAKHGWALEDQ